MKETFGDENLLDVEENVFLFRQLVGLEDQLPFECIGEAKEAAMYLAMCRRRGWSRAARSRRAGPRLDALDEAAVLDRYLSIDVENANLPPDLHRTLSKNFSDNAASTRSFIQALHRHLAQA